MVQYRQTVELFFTGNSEMAMLLRSRDWSQTCLGSVEAWSQSLKTSLNILLNACCPMFLVWGHDRILFYNDAYSVILHESGSPIPSGQPINGNSPPDWNSISLDVEQVFATGRSVQRENQPFFAYQSGNTTAPLYTWCYSPLWDEVGQVGGVFATGSRIVVAAATRSEFDTENGKVSDTSECKQTEQYLRQSEERFRLVTQAVNGLIFDWDLQTNAVYRSGRLYDLVGVRPEDAPPDAGWWHNRIHPDDLVRLQPVIAELFASSRNLYDSEYRVRHEDGHWVDVWEQACLIRDQQGQITRIVGCTVDISERKRVENDRQQAESALREKEQQLQQLSDSMPQFVWICNSSGELEYVNQQWLEFSGLTLEQTQNKTLLANLYHPDDRQLAFERWATALVTQQPFECEARLQRSSDGAYRWFLIRAVPSLNQQGQLLCWYGTSTDIHERKRRELHDQFLNQLDLRLRQLSDVQTVVWETVSSLGEYLDLNRCVFVEIDWRRGLAIVEQDWYRDVPSVSGTYTLSDFISPEFQADLASGQVALIHDVTTDPRTAAFASNYEALQTRAFANAPCIYQGHWVADLTISTNIPRVWRHDEVALLQETIARIFPLIEQTRAVQALRESEERFRITQELSLDAFTILDCVRDETGTIVDFTWTYANPKAAEILQQDAEELIGRRLLEVIPGNQLNSELFERYVQVVETGESHDIEVSYEADGIIGWFRNMAVKLANGVAIFFSDITDRKCIEEALRTSEERLRFAVEGAALGTWEYDLASSQIVWSERAKLMFGVPLDAEVDYELFICSIHPDDRDRIHEAVERSIAEHEIYDVEIRSVWADGSVHWIRSIGRARYDHNGAPTRMIGVAFDITNRKQAEEDVRESERRFRRLVESNMFGVAFGDFTGGIHYVNDYFLNMVGYTREEVDTGLVRWTDITPTEFLPFDERATEELRTTGIATPFEKEYIRKDGSRVPVLIGSALLQEPYNQQQEIIGFFIDLTERKQAEAERENLLKQAQTAREEAETANRIKDEFLAVLSHELRSPLNPILGWSKLLQTRPFDEQATQRALQTIERNAKLQTQLIDDLLDVSRILQGKLALNICPVDLSMVIESALETVRLAAEAKRIQVQTVITADNTQTLGDSARLQQIVWNLLSNAVKFTPEGGRVEVQLKRGSANDSSVLGAAAEHPLTHYAQIIVSDTGKGINPDFLPYVFDYFRQEDGRTIRKFGGLGLGLAIVRHLAELHGGSVHAKSAGEGQGATFIVRLPLITKQIEPNEATISPITHSANLSQLKLLVVDDDEDMRNLIQVILEQQGMEVRVAASAAEALILLDQQLPDLLISDIGMPEIDGYMLMRQIRSRSPEQGGFISAIALTAYAAEYDQQQALKAGFQQHVAKPVDPETLIKVIADLVEKCK